MKIVVRGTNWIGDAVMTVPALRRLRATFPSAEISLLTRAWAEGIFRDADFVDRLLTYAPSGSKRRDLAAQRRLLRSDAFDIAVLFTNSFESALAASLARIPARIGYAREGRGFLLTDSVPVPDWKSERHEVHYYLNLIDETASRLGGLPGATDRSTVDLAVSESRRHGAREILQRYGIDITRPIAALGPGSTNSSAKRWPAASYAALADLLAERSGVQTVVLGTPDETDVADEVVARSASTVTVLAGRTTLAEAVAILSVADILVSNDMGLAHIAPAVGTPTLVIFGPTDDRTTRPIGSEMIRKPVDCAPCMLRTCPIDHRCLTGISPDDVYRKATELLKSKNQQRT